MQKLPLQFQVPIHIYFFLIRAPRFFFSHSQKKPPRRVMGGGAWKTVSHTKTAAKNRLSPFRFFWRLFVHAFWFRLLVLLQVLLFVVWQ